VIGNIDTTLFNAVAKLFEPLIREVINLVFSKGMPMQWLLNLLHLNFVSLDQTLMLPYDGYFIFFCTPTFNI
jgi:hypothetical protein